jgi:type IX secretion system PorP/SprF family membrane protein
MTRIKKAALFSLIFCSCCLTYGQQVPLNPISYRIFSPFLLNPAIAGSKDFFSTDFLAGFNGKSYSQVASGNTRILKKAPGYFQAPKSFSYTNLGVGASVFNDYQSINSTNTSGFSAVFSYHFQLDRKGLSFLSAGVSGKGIYHHVNGDSELNIPSKKFLFPEIDFGIYFYSPSFYAGLSATNFLSPPKDTTALNNYVIPVSRQYNFMIGYKFVISSAINLVFEPSLMLITDDSLSFDLKKSVEPVIRIYASNFCLGTYFNDYSKISFFFQYRYPKFYVGAYFALPKEIAYYKKSITAEIAVGINFSRNNSGYTKNAHW